MLCVVCKKAISPGEATFIRVIGSPRRIQPSHKACVPVQLELDLRPQKPPELGFSDDVKPCQR